MSDEEKSLVLPKRIERLDEFAYNMWWSWHHRARDVFRHLDYQLWRLSSHNPVQQLQKMDHRKLEEAAKDIGYVSRYEFVMEAFDADMAAHNTWVAVNHADKLKKPIAFFSAEFAIHNSLPIYAGGLGVLAGDICKEASDLGLPLIGVGFMYPRGYFSQHISVDGWQREVYSQINFSEAPVRRVRDSRGNPVIVKVQLGDRQVSVGVWLVRVGRVELYLLDTDIEGNSDSDRALASQLYVADQEVRIQQEIILGIGGVRVLRLLGKDPVLWHGNEGHTAFMMVERMRERVARGLSFDEAVKDVRANTVFTTHTPVPAGHDVFPAHLVEKYFDGCWEPLGVNRESFSKLGAGDNNDHSLFNMTALALRLSGSSNGVSRLHGEVTRKMWRGLWPEAAGDRQVPISSITNGVHMSTWLAPEMRKLLDKYLVRDWFDRQDDAEVWQDIWKIPDEEFWAARQVLKRKLMGAMRGRAQERWASGESEAQQLPFMGALLHPEILTIGFVRRFAEYKRPDLIFHDIERLKNIVTNYWRPVQIVFAGKSHPVDTNAKRLLQYVYKLSSERDFQGRIAFIEDYDIHIAHYLVQGIDVWLNTPRRLREASGTSGMKAAINGALNLSVRDGWWDEAYNGRNGWDIDGGPERAHSEDEDLKDVEAIYRLLEAEIAPMFYNRGRKGIPHRWIQMSKSAICSVAPQFCARRMLKEYTERIYIPMVTSQTDISI